MSNNSEWMFLQILLKPILFGLLAGAIFAAVYSLQATEVGYRKTLTSNLPSALGYSVNSVIIGYVAGFLTGTSRSTIVGGVISTVLTLIGGLNIYFFGAEMKNRVIVGYCVFVFTLMLFYGIQMGGVTRESEREARLINLSNQELRIENYRKNLGLDANPPNWLLGGEPTTQSK